MTDDREESPGKSSLERYAGLALAPRTQCLTILFLCVQTAFSADPVANEVPTSATHRRTRSVEKFDLDHDGRISLEEFYSAGRPPLHPRMKQVFDAFDKDHRGSLSYADTAKVIATVSGLKPVWTPTVDGTFRPIQLEVSPQTKKALITASINGVEGRFLLDTGASYTILDTAFARKARVGFVEISIRIAPGSGWKRDRLSLVRVPDMEIAGTHFRKFHAVMLDDGGKERRGFKGRLAGVIGANILFSRPITFDYRNQLLSFPTNTTARHEFTFDLVRNHDESDETAVLNAEIDGVKVALMLDSGAAIGDAILINTPYHRAFRKLAGNPKAGGYYAREVRVAGQLLLSKQRCLLRSFPRSVIGNIFFDRHIITVDRVAGKVWIDHNEDP